MMPEFQENYDVQPADVLEKEEKDPHVIPPYSVLIFLDKHDGNSEAGNDDRILDGKESQCDEDKTQETVASKGPVNDLPKLEEFIPQEYFPEILFVHDPDDLTLYSEGSFPKSARSDDTIPVRYKCIYPTEGSLIFENKDEKPPEEIGDIDSLKENATRTAHLHLSAQSNIGQGNHSLVYRTALSLPPPLRARGPTGQVTVAAKLMKSCDRDCRRMLEREAWIYDQFPRHLMEDWSGYNYLPGFRCPTPVDAVVPKFYAYYVPEDEKLYPQRSAILLLEECGVPIEPEEMYIPERIQCNSQFLRLHWAGFLQNSVAARNILVQPGPLALPPRYRSLSYPRFRIIDFGRGEERLDWFDKRTRRSSTTADDDGAERERLWERWEKKEDDEQRLVKKTLKMDLSCYSKKT
ncbi:uncharacterized protein LAESUDRAFT_673341 [Laetiporus sulphureus 93-53]|uniref:Protein kinase domain-containing protein n=1 Tax=Laetiporus sulphureus 93-53 TaxID=1314785 RepID=A0A165GMD1_9APHY|nr:uncharacterized protein LAESUDRAFT_673341 [Laetiporus sulphureus 93-53]KZT10551.1 hypothetical protein LAESUDRAFT_673341 [Laetiporus sulphureus 93-53]